MKPKVGEETKSAYFPVRVKKKTTQSKLVFPSFPTERTQEENHIPRQPTKVVFY